MILYFVQKKDSQKVVFGLQSSPHYSVELKSGRLDCQSGPNAISDFFVDSVETTSFSSVMELFDKARMGEALAKTVCEFLRDVVDKYSLNVFDFPMITATDAFKLDKELKGISERCALAEKGKPSDGRKCLVKMKVNWKGFKKDAMYMAVVETDVDMKPTTVKICGSDKSMQTIPATFVSFQGK